MSEDTQTSENREPNAEAAAETPRREKHCVSGDRLLGTVKKILHEGNVRRIIIQNEDGRTLIEVPLTLGVVGAALAPVWAAIGAIAALVANCSIIVERAEEGDQA